MSETKDFLDDDFMADEAPVEAIEQAPEPVEDASKGPTRGPDGKFVKAEAEAQASQVDQGAKTAVEADGTSFEPPSDEHGTQVPLSVVQALRKELQELKSRQGTGQSPQTKGPEFAGPQFEFEDDPQGYTQGSLSQMKMQMSAFMASQSTSEAEVQQAWADFDQACANDPQVSAYSYSLVNHPHPMGEVVKWHKQQAEVKAIQSAGGLEALKAQWLAEATGQPAVQSNGNAKPNTPPSLARGGAGASSSDTPADGDAFDALFK